MPAGPDGLSPEAQELGPLSLEAAMALYLPQPPLAVLRAKVSRPLCGLQMPWVRTTGQVGSEAGRRQMQEDSLLQSLV